MWDTSLYQITLNIIAVTAMGGFGRKLSRDTKCSHDERVLSPIDPLAPFCPLSLFSFEDLLNLYAHST